MKFLKRKQGFALIELLVVVSVVGTLSTVVVSSVSTARDNAKIISLKSNMKNLEKTIELETQGDYRNLCSDYTSVDSRSYPETARLIESIKNDGFYFSRCIGPEPWEQFDYFLNFVKLNSDHNYCMRSQNGKFETSNNQDEVIIDEDQEGNPIYGVNSFCPGSYCDKKGCGN